MKKYIGTKEIMAEPMNECIAIKKGFARPKNDNRLWRAGYHVQYANPAGSVYDSWSPKDVFEQSWLRITCRHLSPKNSSRPAKKVRWPHRWSSCVNISSASKSALNTQWKS